MLATVDLLFAVVGTRMPSDHGYALYSSLARLLPCLHDGSVPFAVLPVTGRPVGGGLIALDPHRSRLRLRLSAADLPRVLPLAGKCLTVLGHRVALGVPHVRPLDPAPTLFARTVTFKNATDPEAFLAAARDGLDRLGVRGLPSVPEHLTRDGRPEPHRQVLRIRQTRIVCYSLLVDGLGPEDSFRLQAAGLGGRRHMGSGFFVPAGERGGGHDD
nr:Cas6-related CRISPR-associated protein [uncultured bacterium]